MPIGPGDRVGPYQITALLGAGGMGEVYRARDARLDRDVAIKVLPESFARDTDRVVRFTREAKALAALNHPNIAAIYGVEEQDQTRALVMELVEGRTLAERIGGRPVPVEDALTLAAGIARALEAAHERGIVHRDLKPANVKVRPDGTVKVLDFGLAKAMETASGTPDATTITSTAPMTDAGVVLGTAAYMSPEQARGEPVDARGDIWAFGCVLYEMLTGRRVFEGANATQTIAAVLAGSPDWSRLPPDVPPAIRTLLARCLARDVHQRVRHMSTVLLVLEEQSLLSSASGEVRPATAARQRSARAALVGIGVVLGLLVGLAAAAALGWPWRRPAPARIARMAVLADPLLTGTDRSFALTPDGTRLGYINHDATAILVRSMEALQPEAIFTSPGYLRGLFPSPDGRWFGFVDNIFTIRKVPVTGGPAITVTQLDGPSRGAAWGPGDLIAFATGTSDTGIMQVPASGGAATVLTRPDRERGEADHVQPAWLPDGRAVLFTIVPQSGGLDAARVAVVEPATGKWHTVVEVGYGARYVGSGHLVYAAAGALWAVRFDLSRLATDGDPVEVLRPIVPSTLSAAAQFDVASSGTFVYPQNARTDTDVHVPVWVDRTARETALPAPAGSYRHPRISPDGNRLAVVLNGDIYVWEIGRPWSSASRMTFSPATDWFPVWTPDSRQILFGSWRGGGFSNIYRQQPDSPSVTRLTESPDMQLPTSIYGSSLLFNVFASRIEMLKLDGTGVPPKPTLLIDTPLDQRNGAISPDGRWLAYEGESPTRPGQVDVYVRPFPEVGKGHWQVTSNGGAHPAWASSGRELFYVAPDGTLTVVPVKATETTWRNDSPTAVVRGPYMYRADGSLGRAYDVAPDGTRFLMLKYTAAHDGPAHFVVVQHWAEELKRRFEREGRR